MKRRIVFAGNPGRGKSSLLNCLIGKAVFKSGISIGEGMTYRMEEWQTEDGRCVYYDTPGLNDIARRKDAAEAIREALRQGGNYVLMFIWTLDNGRARPEDLQTLRVVLDAIQLENFPFYIIFNQLNAKVKEQLQANDSKMLQELFALCRTCLDEDKYMPANVLLLDRVNELESADDQVLPSDHSLVVDLWRFLDNAHGHDIEPRVVQAVQADSFEEALAATTRTMEKGLNLMKQQWEAEAKDMKDRWDIERDRMQKELDELRRRPNVCGLQ